jgi:hypothetical protein
MTGWLAVSGVILVLLMSAFVGLKDSGGASTAADVTPVSTEGGIEVTITPTATAEPAPPTATPDAAVNRENCDVIRGTPYQTDQERTWYLANCVNR